MNFVKGILSFVFAVLVILLGLVVWGNYSLYRSEAVAAESTPTPFVPPTQAVVEEEEEEEEPEPEEPVEIPQNTVEITLAYAGDLVCHSGLNAEAFDGETYDYTTLMDGCVSYISNADFSVCCLETTFPDTTDYTGYPMFKSPAGLATSLSTVGFDLITTASNHCMDAYKGGLDATLDVLEENGIDHVGTYRTREERDENNGIVVKEINGISIAFLAYTYGTNGMPVEGFDYAVNLFFKDYLTDLSVIDYDMLDADMAAARALNTDLIVVFMHWGIEYRNGIIREFNSVTGAFVD